jgi:isocitrate dehydrogenase
LDLFVCLRPVRWIPGVPSPVREPEKVDMVIFRENTEDIYVGIEFEQGSAANTAFLAWLGEFYPEEYKKIRFPNSSAIGVKPISQEGSRRLIRAAIRYAIRFNRQKVTLIHKGNIMKFTEGAFARWGYDLAESEFKDHVYTDRQYRSSLAEKGSEAAEKERAAAISQGRVLVNDVITDAAFEQTLTRPEEFDVIATMNLNGDLFSDALAAQVGGLGIAPGANLNDITQVAVFEATHGTAPQLAGKNIANPSSLILSGEMMLNYLGWHEAADLVWQGIQKTVAEKIVTQDFDRLMPDAMCVGSSEFGKAVIQHMRTIAEN